MSDMRAPTFAVVGAVNHGKSSVVAALAEDDEVRISPMPGETIVAQRFGLDDLLAFVDTPGFQNARKALAEIERLSSDAAGLHDDPLAPYRRFIDVHRDDPAFDAERRLLSPIVDGAGILYVVDASLPLRDLHLCEMEVLRRTGAPRLAAIHRGSDRAGDSARLEAWRGRLAQHFNIVREFDSHHATFADRRDLVESLAAIERRWKDRLGEAVRRMDHDRARRIDDAAAVIVDGTVACVAHVERAPTARADATARDELTARYREAVTTIERETHRRVIALFAHRRVSPDTLPSTVLDEGLFADTTWRLLGLDVRQLVGASAVAGGAAGAGIDAAALGHSLGMGALVGAAAGAGSALWLGRRKPEIAIDWLRVPGSRGWRLGGSDLVAGPLAAPNFPWVLLDRALCAFAFVVARSHAKRDEAVVHVDALLPVLDEAHATVRHWNDADRRTCAAFFRAARRGAAASSEQAEILRIVGGALSKIAANERRIVDALAAQSTSERSER